METSEQINELAGALAKAQGEMEGAAKDSDNPFFRSKYADLASVWDACRAPLSKHGLSVVQFPNTEYNSEPEPYEWTSKQGEKRYGVRVVCVVSVLTRLTHASGQWMQGRVSTMLPTGDPQSVGSAVTYLRRYALQSVAGIAPEDDDGEAAHGKGHPVAAAPRAPAVQSSGVTGDIGPLVIEKVGPGRAGALAEVLFTNGDSILTWKPAVVPAAKKALAAGHSVMVTIKASTSGNRYIDELKSTNTSAAQLAATKFQPDAHTAPLTDADIPF